MAKADNYVIDPNGVDPNISEDDQLLWLNRAKATEVISLLDFIDLGISEIQISNNLGTSIASTFPMAGIMRKRVKETLVALRDQDHSQLSKAADTLDPIRTETFAWLKITN